MASSVNNKDSRTVAQKQSSTDYFGLVKLPRESYRAPLLTGDQKTIGGMPRQQRDACKLLKGTLRAPILLYCGANNIVLSHSNMLVCTVILFQTGAIKKRVIVVPVV
eukprot:scaffold99446_cov33-Prasinocladus_malaysianus.AAC.1